MMDNASGLPTCPRQQQQKKTAAQNRAKITHMTSRRSTKLMEQTDAKLLHAAIQGLNRLAREYGVQLRQSYRRIAKRPP
jgi:hypothetical protein